MSFTTIETVKKHLLDNKVVAGDIANEPVKLTAGEKTNLRYPPVTENSEKVKAREQNKPDYEALAFNGSDAISLAKSDLVNDSVVVASDSSLGRIFKENIDYTIDYSAGTLTRIDSGDIEPGASVAVWYIPFSVYAVGIDYSIHYDNGKIGIVSGGSIESGQIVYVDYSSDYAFIDDEVIGNAIEEANEQILNYIDSIYSSSADRSLTIAETYLSVSILCRIKAIRMASGNSDIDTKALNSLADHYRKEAFMLIGKFAGSLGSLKSPQKA